MKTIRIISITLLTMALFAGTALAARSVSTLDRGCEYLAAELAREFLRNPKTMGSTLDMRNFQRLDRSTSLLGSQIREILAEELHDRSDGDFTVVNKANSGAVHDAFDDSGQDGFIIEIDGEQPKKVAAANSGGSFFAVGTYRMGSKYLKITAYIQDKNLRTLATARVNVKINEDIAALDSEPLPDLAVRSGVRDIGNVFTANRKADYLSLFTVSKGKVIPCGKETHCKFRVGSNMGFSVKPPMNSRIYVMNWDPSGGTDEVIMLYPYPNMAIKVFYKGNTYFFPQELDPQAASFPVEPPRGRMLFKIIGVDSNARMNLTSGVTQHPDGYFVLDADGLQHIERKLSTLPPGSWWEQTVDFWIN